ncbi:glycosyltransferase [Sanguibacter sp. Z1732]|uniref:glycosyltransferase n=1 Tax=Sanguibacter sp. Z1732 TaxID=3435412 RepID=UPI003D9CA5E7
MRLQEVHREESRKAYLRSKADADTMWKRDRKRESLDIMREALLKYPSDSSAWYTYGMRLLEVGRGDSAFEALKNSIHLDPLNFDALEVLMEVARKRDPRGGYTAQALKRLDKKILARPERHREALDFAIPGRRVALLKLLAASPDPVTRAVVALADAERSGMPIPEDVHESGLPSLIYALGRGRIAASTRQMDEMDSTLLPIASIRRAARRSLNKNDAMGAHRLLEHYLRGAPHDGWARAKYAETRTDELTVRELTTMGYPVPTREAESVSVEFRERALYLVHNSLPYHSAGYATRTQGVLNALRERGWDLQAITRLGYPFDMDGFKELHTIPQTDSIDGVPYRRLHRVRAVFPRQPLQNYVERYAYEVERIAKARGVFAIHAASNYVNGLAGVIAANRIGIPSIYEVRGLWEITRGSRDASWMNSHEFHFHARMELEAARHSSSVITITDALAAELVERGVDEAKIRVVPNGVDVSKFDPVPRNEALARELGLAGRTVVGYVGSLLDYEGLDLLIRAFAAIPDVETFAGLLIVGDGPMRSHLQRLARELRLESIVRFPGRVDHDLVSEYYSVIDIAPFPRLPLPVCEMVSPLKPLEAMAMQKAVIASDVAALAEMVREGETGRLHAKGDVDSLSGVLSDLLASPQLREDLARKGREWVRNERSWPKLVEALHELYVTKGGIPDHPHES